MRTTYEDLLRMARRAAMRAHQVRHTDHEKLLSGWESVLAATRAHLGWLRYDLDVADGLKAAEAGPAVDTDLGALARVLGAGADLLATQDWPSALALENYASLVTARAEVADIALIAGRTVLRDLGLPSRSRQSRSLFEALEVFEGIVLKGRGSPGLGFLGDLTTKHPRYGTDASSQVCWMAVRWERAHQEVAPRGLLARDLRSTTSQLRTVGGYARYLAECASAAANAVGFHSQLQLRLGRLKNLLLAADAGAARASHAWQHRVSDVGGPSDAPGEFAFFNLKTALDVLLRPQGDLLSPRVLMPHQTQAVSALDALDGLLDAAAQVAGFQQGFVDNMIRRGHLFVPRQEMADTLPAYCRRLGEGVGGHWLPSDLPSHFTELSGSHTWIARRLSAAAVVARDLASIAHRRWPPEEKHSRVTPLSIRRRSVAQGTGFPDQGQEPAGPGR
jgi:hypothetical protein